MKERPILFSGAMVRAILAGTKTQTRRVVKGAPDDWAPLQPQAFWTTVVRRGVEEPGDQTYGAGNEDGDCWIVCPYGQPGDRLWVRETFAVVPRTAYAHSKGVQQTLRTDDPYEHDAAIYRAGWDRSSSGLRWRPSIHMPRWASRISLEITGVRLERLQAISDADLECEGLQETIDAGIDHDGTPRDAWRALWSSINGAESWAADPWVWVVDFMRVEVGHV